MAHFKQAPLPFIGQKRLFLKHFEKVLNDNIPHSGEGWTIIDVFGGSGLLSHAAKRLKPNSRVIYNDFDGYTERLNHIDDINRLRQILNELLSGQPRQKRLPPDIRRKVIDEIEAFKGYKDPHILCSWLLFSGQQISSVEELYHHGFYNCIRRSDYPIANGYLDGIEVVNESFHQLLPKFQSNEKAMFVLDPPYLCTDQAAYKQATYFDLIDFLRLIHLTRPPYIFFSSTKSEFLRFVEYLVQSKANNWQSFEKVEIITLQTSTSYSGKYEDNLVYKF